MSMDALNALALELVADDFSLGHRASQGGPTKTSRALAIIHLAGHDAYAKVTGTFAPKLGALPAAPGGSATDDAAGAAALMAAGCRAAAHLYPDFVGKIEARLEAVTGSSDPELIRYGMRVAEAWLCSRLGDGSDESQEDVMYDPAPGHHRPDPFNPIQKNLGRNWGHVTPFVLTSVASQAPLGSQPALTSQAYATAYEQVFDDGTAQLTERDEASRRMAAIGVFWGYDGANLLGTPPRLYNQVVNAIPQVTGATHAQRVRWLTAINVAMADAGIAAWHWKYVYDFWRPGVAIREADSGWGPTGQGDQNTLRNRPGDPFWRPLGAPRSNPFPTPMAGGPGANFTPNFPAYPSGHASFGTACFETIAALLGGTPETVSVVDFASDEFNGKTTDNNGVTRPRWTRSFTLREAVEENKLSRIYLGVHWVFDATGGEAVGKAVADLVGPEFM